MRNDKNLNISVTKSFNLFVSRLSVQSTIQVANKNVT